MKSKSQINPCVWAIIAMVCPILLLIILVIVAPSIPNYNPFMGLISTLSLGNFGWLGVLFFALSAITILAFARGLSGSIELDRKTRTALTLLYLTAVCLLSLIFIDIDHEHGIWTLKRVIHWTIASVATAFFTVSCYSIARSLKGNASWHGIPAFTVVLALITVVVGACMAFNVRSGLVGLLERLIMASGVIWVEVMSFRIFRLCRKNHDSY
jgi:hypothetical protein